MNIYDGERNTGFQNTAIYIKNLCKEYPGGIKALQNLSFSVNKGDIHGLLGPNGNGKTTTMRILMGLIAADSGQVSICGFERPTAATTFKSFKLSTNLSSSLANEKTLPNTTTSQLIGYLPENPPLYLDMTVYDFLFFTSQIHGMDKKLIKNRLPIILEQLQLSNVTKRIIGNLSKGYRQRVGLAMVLIRAPQILILDEPTVGLDPSSIFEIRQLINSLRGKHTVLLSTHQLHEVSSCCNSITIIKDGRAILSGDTELIKESFKNNTGQENISAPELEEIFLQVIKDNNYYQCL